MAASKNDLATLISIVGEGVALLRRMAETDQRSFDQQRRDSSEQKAAVSSGLTASAGGGSGGGLAKGFGSAARSAAFFTDPFQTEADKAFGSALALGRAASSRLLGDPDVADVAFNLAGFNEKRKVHQDATANTRALLNRYAAAGGTVTPELVRNVFGAQRAQAERINAANQVINKEIGAADALGVKEMLSAMSTQTQQLVRIATAVEKQNRHD